MKALELLAPARNAQIGIAAIDCGADAVYIGAEAFGARKDATNPMEDIRELCDYAHRFGARVFLTVNTVISDEELDRAHSIMREAQDAGIDAFIIRDVRTASWDDIKVPLHASTQCAIRDPQRARYFESIGCERIILERELSLEQIKDICDAVSCEVECFVHGALCVCYSGDCRLSEAIDGRSADKGECIQACRSLYDLEDADGRTILKDKAVLSLKDFKLLERLEDLCEAGATSFKIEGRLKNASYVKNVVREYSLALDDIVRKHPDQYRRASFGQISGGFTPDSNRTFNRSYTELFLDGRRGRWAAMDAPKSMGEMIGTIASMKPENRFSAEVRISPSHPGIRLRNGDGFAVIDGTSISGFRGDVCEGNIIHCKMVPGLHNGAQVFRNISSEFERELENNMPRREIRVSLDILLHDKFSIDIKATSEDGREVLCPFKADLDTAINKERAEALIREQLSKRSDGFIFRVRNLDVRTSGGIFPLLSVSTINSIRRLIAGDLNGMPCGRIPLAQRKSCSTPPPVQEPPVNRDELMRSKYCVRYELGLCPTHQGAKTGGPLYLTNNGHRLELRFDCKRCEMTVREAQK